MVFFVTARIAGVLDANGVRILHGITVFSELPTLERIRVCRLRAKRGRPEIPAAYVLPDVGLRNSRIRHTRREFGIRLIERAWRRSTASCRRDQPPSKSLLQYVPSAVAGSPFVQVCASDTVALIMSNVIARMF